MPEMDGFALAEEICDDTTLAGPPVLMLNSMDLIEESHRAIQSRLFTYIVKPITSSGVQRAILEALGLGGRRQDSLTTSKSVCTHRARRILIAEDNIVNQKVIATLLEKRGHSITLACNGCEAVDHYRRGQFDIIFMDVQMPVMNGYDATGTIRQLERDSGNVTPIIALTAHTMKGDREQCLAAGMDAYLSKPVGTGELEAI